MVAICTFLLERGLPMSKHQTAERTILTIEEVSGKLSELGSVRGKISMIKAAIDEKVRQLHAEHAEEIDGLTARDAELTAELVDFADNDIGPYLDGPKRTIKLRGGVIGHALTARVVEFTKTEEAIIAWLKKKRWLTIFTKVVRSHVLVNAKLTDNPDMARKIPGVEFVRYDNVVVDPVMQQAEIIAKPPRRRVKGKRVPD